MADNPIVIENRQRGSPRSEWDVGAGSSNIQGFASDISVNRGSTINFKINTDSNNYRIDIYRLGYYQGDGARKVTTIQKQLNAAQKQPNPLKDTTTGLVDAGNWAVSASWTVPTNATSGVYIANLVRQDGTAGASQIPFIVRDDASRSALVFETSDTTWEAYNTWGGNSLYTGGPGTNPNRAYKVSYNRPFTNRAGGGGTGPRDYLFDSDYPMLRWLEANGYDVSYMAGVDGDRNGNLIRNHSAFLSVGHDEYWSGGQRANVEAARDNGVNLAFFSGNEVFWKTRWENSIDRSNTPYRTLVSYKETHANTRIDPKDPPTATATWRDPRFGYPSDGGRPENALTGTIFTVNQGSVKQITVPAEDGQMRFWRNTTVANNANHGQSTTLNADALTYEWDEDLDNGSRPAGLFHLSSTTDNSVPQYLQDYGSTYASGSATHRTTLYKSGRALVFSAGTPRWSWGLSNEHDLDTDLQYSQPYTPDASMQQATVNLFADMGVQPATLTTLPTVDPNTGRQEFAALVPASVSTDITAPTSTITSPAASSSVAQGAPLTIAGTASDSVGGMVGGVEVSVDNGTSWHPANGRANWTYSWTPQAAGPATLKSRAVDDSGNLETPGSGVNVTVGASTTTGTSIWSASATPTVANEADDNSTEVGVKFRANTAGSITGIRFYKSSQNTGPHVVSLWSNTSQQLATATSSNETASGWQTVNFATPVSITASTTYVASYLAPKGHYADDQNYFTNAVSSSDGSLTALANGTEGPNGVYAYTTSSAFPTNGFNASNYWVDVLFNKGQLAA